MSEQQTKQLNNIQVNVDTHYIENESIPSQARYIFSYTITIENIGNNAAQLLRRHWIITDENGKVQEVQGDGVVGDQPYLQAGEKYQYTSGTLLATSMGTMKGKYTLVNDDGDEFDAIIPEFLLSIPRTVH